jgi:hypothetical protein
MADLPSDDAESCGLNLASHVALWDAMRAIVARDVDLIRDDGATAVLEAAQTESGTNLSETSVRDNFLGGLRSHVIPAARLRDIVDRLARADFDVTVYGANWTVDNARGATVGGVVPTSAELNRAMNETDWVVLPVNSASALQIAVDTLSSGSRVAMRAAAVPLGQSHAELGTIIESIVCYRSTDELLKHIRSAGWYSKTHQQTVIARISEAHCVKHRIAWIADRVRDRRVQAIQSVRAGSGAKEQSNTDFGSP